MQNGGDELTENGILSDRSNVSRANCEALFGEPLGEYDGRVIFATTDISVLTDFAEKLGVERHTLSARMRLLADVPSYGDIWRAADPVVFDARTFDEEE